MTYSVAVERVQRDPNAPPMLDVREIATVWAGPSGPDGQKSYVRLVEQYGSPRLQAEWGNDRIYWGTGTFSFASGILSFDFRPEIPEATFPWWIALPRTRLEAARGWSAPGVGDRIYSYRLAEGSSWSDRQWRIERLTDSLAMKQGGGEERARFVFDRDRACLTEIDIRRTYARDSWKEYRITARLSQFRKLSQAEQAGRESDGETCLAVMEAFDTAARHDGEADEAVVRAGIADFLRKAGELPAKVSEPEFRQDAAWLARTASDPAWQRLIVETAARRARINGAGVGLPSPGWTWPDLAGKTHALGDYRGKVVLLDFWGIACVPCLRAMPELQRLAEAFRGRPVAVVGVNAYGDGPQDIEATLRRLGVSYVQLRSPSASPYGVEGYPSLVLIDANGVIRYRHTGFAPGDGEGLRSRIEALLKP